MLKGRLRHFGISLFVVLWVSVFHYESLRYFYLQPFFNKPLPKTRFLFPPVGWIMFFNVDDQFGTPQVYGRRDELTQAIDPHDILRTRTIGYDNIRRNVLSEALEQGNRPSFCAFLERKFPQYESFSVNYLYYPSLSRDPGLKIERPVYECR